MKRARSMLSAVLIATLLGGCVPKQVAAPPRSSRVTVVMGARPLTMNPYSPSLSARRMGRLVFSGLFTQGAEGPVADLAQRVPTVANGDISADGRSATIRLKKRAWHDGAPVTASDVVFTWRLLRDGALTDSPAQGIGAVTDVTAADEQTLRVTLARPDTPSLWRLVPYVLPEHLLSTSVNVSGDIFWARPVGSGPYRVRTSTAEGIALDPVKDGVAIDVAFAASGERARSLFDRADRAVWLDAPKMGAASDSESYDATGGVSWRMFQMNVRPGHATADPAVRRALALTLVPDQTAAGTVGLFGLPDLQSQPDTWTAARVLREAGWRKNRDGVLTKGGEMLRIRFANTASTVEEGSRTSSITATWRGLGIAAEEIAGSGAPFYAPVNESGMLAAGDFDVAWTSIRASRPVGFAWPYDSRGMPGPEAPFGPNLTGAQGAAMDAFAARIRAAGDPAAAREAATGAYERLYGDHVIVPDTPMLEAVLSKGVTGVRSEPVAEDALSGITAWKLRQR